MARVCAHAGGWEWATGPNGAGAARCESCGVIRFLEYGTLRPSGLPEATTPSRVTSVHRDRAAAQWLMRRTRRRRNGGWPT
ncbi:DUF6255 family natural product biosynthesis protein [Streptomyces sp. NPDC002537]